MVNFPLFGEVCFWAQFVFLGVSLLVLITALFRTPKLDEGQLDEDDEAEEEEGLLASAGRRFGAAWEDITGMKFSLAPCSLILRLCGSGFAEC